MVRLLAAKSRIYNVLINGIVDTSPRDVRPGGVILIGDRSYSTGERDNIFAVSVSDVLCDSATAFQIEGYRKDSVITNVDQPQPRRAAVSFGGGRRSAQCFDRNGLDGRGREDRALPMGKREAHDGQSPRKAVGGQFFHILNKIDLLAQFPCKGISFLSILQFVRRCVTVFDPCRPPA